MQEHQTAEQPSGPEIINLEELELIWGAGGGDSYAGLVCETLQELLVY